MRIVRDFLDCPADCRGAVVALGNFDGVHLGHQAILRHAAATARATGGKTAVMTFEPHPREFFSKSHEKLRLYSFRNKAELLEEAGVEILYAMRFNRALASMSAEAFVSELLHKALAVRHVVTGSNFAFGRGRQGTTEFLDKTAAALGMGYTACPPVLDAAGRPVSSSAIRAALAAGDVAKAAALLGRPYAISGRVRRGEQRGAALGFPTANLSLARLFKPRFGVYAVRARIGGDPAWRDAVASLGVKPTFGAFDPLLEVHLFAMNRTLYGECLRVEFSGFLRDEKRFPDADTLRRQMEIDCIRAKEVLHAGQ